DRWHVERWMPPESYGSPEMWRAQTTETDGGISIPALGPYPARGDYEHCFTLAGPRGEFIPLSPAACDWIVRAVEWARRQPRSALRAAVLARESRRAADFDRGAEVILDDAAPAFHAQPFVPAANAQGSPIRKDNTQMQAPSSATATSAAHGFGARRDVVFDTAAKQDAAATVSIASISDQDWYVSRTHGVYHIPACTKGEAYALLMITARGDALDLGDNRRLPFVISAREIAEDLLQDLHDHGVFVCAGARPTAEELAAATVRRDAYYHRLIAEGDTLWARGHSFREISDMHRRAAIALGVEREWAYVPTRTSECPVCGEKIKHGVAVCKHCHAILDADKAAKHGLHNPAAASQSRAQQGKQNAD
ncbi:MAG: hypothetical protein KGL75_10825, partial [Acidobacteriota bacterium]|nr:hypothetical protein [Acidobacteriota bacterium]